MLSIADVRGDVYPVPHALLCAICLPCASLSPGKCQGWASKGSSSQERGLGHSQSPAPLCTTPGGFGLSSPGLGSLLWKMEAVPELGLLRCSPAAEKQIYPS